MGLFDALFGGSSESSGGGYGGFVNSLFGGSESPDSSPHKVAHNYDAGISGFGSQDQYQPHATTFMRNGRPYRNTEEYLDHLDRSTCYSGTLICPICRQPKSSPSELERCKAKHRADGWA